jgi:hypothetical protein
MQRIISKRMVTVAAMVAMVLAMAVPTFAQGLPQSSDPGGTDPGAGEESVPNQDTASSTEPSSTGDAALPTTSTNAAALPTSTDTANNDPAAPAEDSATDVIPIKLSSELCAEVTDPLVSGTFAHVLPELVQGCLKRSYLPAGSSTTAPVQSASEPTHTPPVNPAPVVEPGGPVKPAPVDTTAPADTTTTDTTPVNPAPTDTTSTDTAPTNTP